MKKMIVAAMCLMALAACKQTAVEQKNAQFEQQRDSLNRVIAQKDIEINDMVGTLNDIEEGFRAINEAEQRVTVAREGEGSTAAVRIRENMQYIAEQMEQNRELINKLRTQVRQSSVNADEMRRTIDNLTRQLEEKNEQIKQLQADLASKDVQIQELTTEISALTTHVNSLKAETTQKSQTINVQDKQLNAAWFVFGTKKELKEQHIIEDGKVLQSNFNRDYFTKIDIRVDKEIRLYSRSAQLLTSHPASSYQLQTDANKQYVLRITNPQLFWSTSKYLVILVK